MSVNLERWMFLGTFVLAILFVCLFIWPNYTDAEKATAESRDLEEQIEQLEIRQAEVEQLRQDFQTMKQKIELECKQVPRTPDTARIVQVLSLDIDGHHVLDQSFTAGVASSGMHNSEEVEGFSIQPLAVTLQADFESIFSVIQNVESMNRLVKVTSIQMSRSKKDVDELIPSLEAAIGLHVMFDTLETP